MEVLDHSTHVIVGRLSSKEIEQQIRNGVLKHVIVELIVLVDNELTGLKRLRCRCFIARHLQ
ncbi:hypothetical protein DJ71_24690 [Halorubrum sp. E3]|nr:hypothetical protein DJ71_24690 [Halorubrum sp. E3]